jgi:hypothetical protein
MFLAGKIGKKPEPTAVLHRQDLRKILVEERKEPFVAQCVYVSPEMCMERVKGGF